MAAPMAVFVPAFAPPLPPERDALPRITVALSVYNGARHLPAAIASIGAQTFGNFECLIVDDGSTDDSRAIADVAAARDPRFRVLHQANQGLVAALNRIAALARAPLIARMDADDIALPARFAAQIAFLDAHPGVGVLGSGCSTIDESGALTNKDEEIVPTAAIPARLHEGPPLCHPSVIMRRDLLIAVGGYRSAYRHCEDYDLWLRLAERTTLANLPERLLLYRRHASQVSSRHTLVQKYGAAVAWEAHLERMAGRTDPTDGLEALPPLAALDDVFGRAGVMRTVRAKVALGIVYAPSALRSEGLDLILAHVRDGGDTTGLWRTVARLVTLGAPLRAARLAAVLATT